MRKFTILLACVAALNAATVRAQERVETNVVYGMYSGLALLMDVHRPATSNGRGVIYIAGSGFQAPTRYSATPLKDQQNEYWVPALLQAGYTVFAINHRAAPRFHYPAPVEDVQRAVRFVRQNAKQFGVDPTKLGGIGGSSGGYLIAMVGMLAAPGLAEDRDPVNGQPATLQCVVVRAAPTDLLSMIGTSGLATAAVVSFLDRAPTPDDQKLYRSASPLTLVSPSAPPTLLLHGDADDTIPFQQSVAFEAALTKAGVPVKLVRVADGKHSTLFGADGTPHRQMPELLRETVGWLNQYLLSTPAK